MFNFPHCREKADSRICTFGQNIADHTRHVCSIFCLYWYSLLVCMSLGYATIVKDIWPYLQCNCTKIKADRSICVVTAVCLNLVCRYCGLPCHTCSYCCLPCFSCLFTYLIKNYGLTLQKTSS